MRLSRPQTPRKTSRGETCCDVAAEAVNPKLAAEEFCLLSRQRCRPLSRRTENKWLRHSFPRRTGWSDKTLSRRRSTSLQQVRRRHPAAQRSQEADIKIPNQTCRGIHGSAQSSRSRQSESGSRTGGVCWPHSQSWLERCITHNDTLAVFLALSNTERWSQRTHR